MKQFVRRIRSEQLILDAAKELIREKGCRQTTLAQLMKKTALSKGALYHYISSKDDLMAKVMTSIMEETNDLFLARLSEGEESYLHPEEVLAGQISALDQPGQIISEIFTYFIARSDEKAAREALDEFYDNIYQFALLWIRSGQKNGSIHKGIDPHKLAELYLLLLDGFRLRKALGQSGFTFNAGDTASLFRLLFTKDLPAVR
ncbi:TetR family transcriptional regulator [Bacillus mangrovi]|uniref:TetR family transcriptional regulator n=1 Tax=Metabacillus mangrovi TaxID=1491830 RepID=A0A7X2S2D3_9BACI|nr:TetR/AcrR family transcriptional regulator [Metabacillus mangrovi]MTH51956.1 TetR family transcriptional regulator [Metabacillus mangrovi]